MFFDLLLLCVEAESILEVSFALSSFREGVVAENIDKIAVGGLKFFKTRRKYDEKYLEFRYIEHLEPSKS